VIALIFAGVLSLADTAIAVAKGPDAVTLTGPDVDSSVVLSDAVDGTVSCDPICPPDPMVRLMEQSGLWFAAGDLPRPIGEPTGQLGPPRTLTWRVPGLLYGIRQVIYLEAEDGPLIHTPQQEGLEEWGPGVIGWFKAPDGIVDTLVALGAPLSASEGSGRGNAVLAAIGVALLTLVGTALRHSRSPGRRSLSDQSAMR
jgi:hypothetical protein